MLSPDATPSCTNDPGWYPLEPAGALEPEATGASTDGSTCILFAELRQVGLATRKAMAESSKTFGSDCTSCRVAWTLERMLVGPP